MIEKLKKARDHILFCNDNIATMKRAVDAMYLLYTSSSAVTVTYQNDANPNFVFYALKNKRSVTDAGKPESYMKQERLEVDDANRALTKRVNALAEVNGVAACEPFIKELNQIIDEISLSLAQRKSGKVSEPSTPTIN